MSYEIKYEPVTINGTLYPKWNIYYFGGTCDGLKEFFSTTGGSPSDGFIRPEYIVN